MALTVVVPFPIISGDEYTEEAVLGVDPSRV
jgi:hypothetical protein